MLLVVFLYLLLPIPSLTRSGFFNRMLEIFELVALNYNTFSRLISLTLSVTRDPTLTHLPLFGSLDSLLRELIALTSGLTFFLPMTRTLAVTSLFSSCRAYPSLNLLPPLSLFALPLPFAYQL